MEIILAADSVLSALGYTLLEGFLPLLASIATVAAIALIKKSIDKLGVERSQEVDSMIDKYVKIGIGYAQKYAENKLKSGAVTLSEDKLAVAVKTVVRELDQSGIKGVAEDLIIARIESELLGETKKESS